MEPGTEVVVNEMGLGKIWSGMVDTTVSGLIRWEPRLSNTDTGEGAVDRFRIVCSGRLAG
jgi:hypothetical protein